MEDPRIELERGIRAAFDSFIEAQNAHDIDAISRVITHSPEFLWITTTKPLWGYDAALLHFAHVYKGTYHLEPKLDELKLTIITHAAAQLYVPVDLTIGPSDKEAQRLPFMLHQTYVATAQGWKIAAILPIRGR